MSREITLARGNSSAKASGRTHCPSPVAYE